MIKILLCHFCLVQKQCDVVGNAEFSQKLWRNKRDNLVRVENFIKCHAIFALDPSVIMINVIDNNNNDKIYNVN